MVCQADPSTRTCLPAAAPLKSAVTFPQRQSRYQRQRRPASPLGMECLTRWGRVTHACVSKLTIICSDNGLSPARRQASIWTNAVVLLIGTLGTNISALLSEIQTFSYKKVYCKMSSEKWQPFCLDINVLIMSRVVYCNEGHLFLLGPFHPHDMWLERLTMTYCICKCG